MGITPLTSPWVIGWVDSFRNVYARTGMNLVQSIVVVAVAMAQQGWRGALRQVETTRGSDQPRPPNDSIGD
jgi:hypothetical protein